MKSESDGAKKTIRNLFALIAGAFAAWFVQNVILDNTMLAVMTFSIVTLAVMYNNTTSKLFSFVKKGMSCILFAGFTLIFYQMCSSLLQVEHYVLKGIGVGAVSFLIFLFTIPAKGETIKSLKMTLCRVSGCVSFAAIGILLYGFVAGFLGWDFVIIRIILTVVYCFFAWFSACYLEKE